MSVTAARASFEQQTADGGDGDQARTLAQAVRARPDADGLRALAALWLHAAAAAPERLAEIYDGSAEGWLGDAGTAPAVDLAPAPAAPVPDAFWTAFWALLAEPPGSLGAGGVTQRTAELAGLVSPDVGRRVAKAALAYPGVAAAAAQGFPARFRLADLAACPRDSLGGAFHALIVDNGFDLEVLDRDALGLSGLEPPLDYLNARILQCHDLWHIAAGYETTALHEVAISGFQMGQFGHHYSSMFLAMVLSRIAFERAEAGGLMLDVILSAWRHGRRSPPLLGVRWETIWDRPLETVRKTLGLSAYASPYPADLFEQAAAA